MIVFKTVRFKNFGSFGNSFTEVKLGEKSTTLVCGSNGNGKSFALLDSIAFGLYGRPFRNINIPQLVNSVNKKNCVVEINFSIGKNEVKVIRGLAPKLFEIYKDGNLLNQDAKIKDYQEVLESQILGMNFKTFSQVVVLGSSSFVPFMQLTPTDRRQVIENILDISIFSQMNVVVKDKVNGVKSELDATNTQIEVSKAQIADTKETIQSLVKNTQQIIEERKAAQAQLKAEMVVIQTDIDKLSEPLKISGTSIQNELKEVQKKRTDAQKILGKIEQAKESINEDIEFFNNNETCSLCKQGIAHDHKDALLGQRKTKLDEYQQGTQDINTQIAKTEKQIEEIQGRLNEHQTNVIRLANKRETLKSLNTSHANLELNNAKTYSQEEIAKFESKLVELENKEVDLIDKKYKVLKTLKCYDQLINLFKDSGIKSKIIKYYIPLINKHVNKYLTSMDFYAIFNLDEEFKEIIKSRHRDIFTYESFSEGEKMRIDLALLLTWREIARLKNSVSTNLLILDEVFDSSLDGTGTDEFMKLISSFGSKVNVFVISHKTDQLLDRFGSIIQFEKKRNFSRLV